LNNYSTASPLNHAQEIAPKIATELLECWEKVIKAAVDIFKGADKLLCSAGDSVIEEIAQTERGDGYLRCLNHLYFVVCRVQRSAKSELPPNCREDIALCEKVWKRLSAFIVDPEEEDKSNPVEKPCAICCQPVTKAVYFGGQTYHTECANLWVNDVNSLLPNMHLNS
uniref:Zf-CRD domain-containing protein n=1 Tax=Nippostrongylus brasiliensis TaxID=27835 RepID=A0A0N4YD11_NIPBR